MGPVGRNARLITQQNTSHHIPFFLKKSIYLPHLGRYFDFWLFFILDLWILGDFFLDILLLSDFFDFLVIF